MARRPAAAIVAIAVWTLFAAAPQVGRSADSGSPGPVAGPLVAPSHLEPSTIAEPAPAYNGLIAYVAPGPVAGSPDPAPQVWVMTPDGQEQRPLTSSYGTAPAWSPDGTQIAYVSRSSPVVGSPTDIWVMNADGSGPRKVTDTDDVFESTPTWSPDGTRIAYVVATSALPGDPGVQSDIWIIDADGTDARNLSRTDLEREVDPSWSPVGDQLAYACTSGDPDDIWAICLIGVDGTGRSEIPREGGAVDPVWSPDGSRLAFISAWDAGWGTVAPPPTAVFTMAPTGADVVQLESPYGSNDPAWSPDGRYIAVTSLKSRIGPSYISLIRSDGLVSPWCIACDDHLDRSQPAWQPVSERPDPSGEFTPLTPARILDTRSGLGRDDVAAPLEEDVVVEIQVAGKGGVPANGVAAVVMNVTVVRPTASSYLTVWPTGSEPPATSNLNYVAGQTIPNHVTVAVGDGGRVNVANRFGTAHVIFDGVGYYADEHGPAGSRYRAVDPVRLFDTRTGLGDVPAAPVGPDGVLAFRISGSGITALVMNVTAARATEPSYLTVFPGDLATPPFTSNLNFGPGQPVPNLVTVRVPADGTVKFHNRFGSVDVVADVVGYFDERRPTEAGRFLPVDPFRYVDSRELGEPVGAGGIWVIGDFPGFAGFEVGEIEAAVLNVTVARPTAWSYLSVFPSHLCGLPEVSNLNFVAGQTVPNQVVARLGTAGGCATPDEQGAIAAYNHEGTTHVVVDVFGIYTAATTTQFG